MNGAGNNPAPPTLFIELNLVKQVSDTELHLPPGTGKGLVLGKVGKVRVVGKAVDHRHLVGCIYVRHRELRGLAIGSHTFEFKEVGAGRKFDQSPVSVHQVAYVDDVKAEA